MPRRKSLSRKNSNKTWRKGSKVLKKNFKNERGGERA